MPNFTYTALTPIKVGGVIVREGEEVVLDSTTGEQLVEEQLVELASDTPVEVEDIVAQRKTVAKKTTAPAKKKAR